MLAPESKKCSQQLVRIERTVGVEPGGIDGRQRVLGAAGEYARNDFAVNWIGDRQCATVGPPHQSQINHVLSIIRRHIIKHAAGQNRLDHAADTLLTQFVGQLAQVGLALQNEDFFGGVDMIELDRCGNRLGQVLRRRLWPRR